MISALLLPLLPKILGGLAIVVGLVGAYFGIRHAGAEQQRTADAQRTLKSVEVSQNVQTEVAGKSDAAVADDLRSKWTR